MSPTPKTRRDVPGPRGHLLLGNLPEIRRDVLGFYQRLARDYGDVSVFKVLTFWVVVVNDPALIEQVLVTDRDKLEKSWDYMELARVLGKGLLTNEGEDWQRKRRLIQPSFHHDRISAYGEIMSRRASERTARWTDGETLMVDREMSTITLQVIAESMLGTDIDDEAGVIAEALDRFMEQFEKMFASLLPLPLWVPTPGNRAAFRHLKQMDEILYRIIADRRARGGGGDDLLGRLLAARFDDESGRSGGLSDQELRDELITMVMAGHETTALALTWAIMLLAQHPEVEARLVAELDEVLGGRAPTLADIERLRFTRQVFEETLRLYPPAWGVGRQVKKGETLHLGGYDLVGGTQIALAQFVTHRDPRFFDEPDAFKPERWAEGAPRPPKYAYFPFAGGPRSCVGMHFAMMEGILVLAEVMQRARFHLVQEHPIDLQPAITLRPRHGLKARVELRERAGAKRSHAA